ncbi:signal peptide peptidase SppA [Mangrovibacillus cuniculi]|uniref:Signal peptide peptidase SppA n=1 Tax=Mangrovibacillus cuniculi TaxID=2593652 RepID=A0A7S8CCE4_9BACI|nr:signal peptide peptidase SppA [Mangrovibacillus cuniculi]QPC47233.1 signal peptide peptidase SppA [Mangrovibacillus cuniculi]
MNKKRWGALVIAGILLVGSLVTNAVSQSVFSQQSQSFEDLLMNSGDWEQVVIEEGTPTKSIALLTVDGVIQDTNAPSQLFESVSYNHDQFIEQLEHIAESDDFKGAVISVNTPGGGVMESAQIHKKIQEVQKAGKPVYISMGAMAASGGYYIAAPADKIFASQETLTGSLGVIMQSINFEGLAEKYGVDFVTIKSGPYKDIMSSYREMTDEERNILQGMVDRSYDGFVKVISEGRGMSEQDVRRIADGRIYDGYQAKELNLIDEFGYEEDAIQALKKDHNLGDAQVVSLSKGTSFASLFQMGAKKMIGDDLGLVEAIQTFSNPNAPRLMYLYAE